MSSGIKKSKDRFSRFGSNGRWEKDSTPTNKLGIGYV